MLDLAGIVFSSVIMLLVIVRAIRLDAETPWFGKPAPQTRGTDLKPRQRTAERSRDTPPAKPWHRA